MKKQSVTEGDRICPKYSVEYCRMNSFPAISLLTQSIALSSSQRSGQGTVASAVFRTSGSCLAET